MSALFNSAALNACPKEVNTISRVSARTRSAFNGTGEGQTVHLRHLHIQKRQVVRLASFSCGSQLPQGFLATGGTISPSSATLQADGAGFDDWWRCHRPPGREIGQITAAAFGRRGVAGLLSSCTTEPLPGSLSTPIWPSMRTTNYLEIARPKPVPPYLRVV